MEDGPAPPASQVFATRILAPSRLSPVLCPLSPVLFALSPVLFPLSPELCG